MPEIIDRTTSNLLVQHDDGNVELIARSEMNRLLYEHDLWGLLRDGSQAVVFPEQPDRGNPRFTIVPNDDATAYELMKGQEGQESESVFLGEHKKSELVSILHRIYDGDGEDTTPLFSLFERVREQQVRQSVIRHFAEMPPFAGLVEVTDGGWLINGHLMLTWEGEFHHPNTTSRQVSGSSVSEGASEHAYHLRLDSLPEDGVDRTVTIHGEQVRLSTAEMEFMAKAMWGVVAAPRL